jgi:hypothetical protein
MRGDDDRAVLAAVLDELPYLDDLGRVEADRRLVEDEHLWVAHERLRKADALAVALAEVSDHAARHLRNADARADPAQVPFAVFGVR